MTTCCKCSNEWNVEVEETKYCYEHGKKALNDKIKRWKSEYETANHTRQRYLWFSLIVPAEEEIKRINQQMELREKIAERKKKLEEASHDSDVVPGIKVIYHTGEVDIEDDPSMPFKLEANFRPPEFMIVAFIGLYGGSEEVIVRDMTLEALNEFAQKNHLKTHPRLRKLTLTGPDGIIEEISK